MSFCEQTSVNDFMVVFHTSQGTSVIDHQRSSVHIFCHSFFYLSEQTHSHSCLGSALIVTCPHQSHHYLVKVYVSLNRTSRDSWQTATWWLCIILPLVPLHLDTVTLCDVQQGLGKMNHLMLIKQQWRFTFQRHKSCLYPWHFDISQYK